jgi:hypothetical protein
VGGVDEGRALRRLVSEQGADVLAAETAGLDAPQTVALASRHREARAAAEERYRETRWAQQQVLRSFVVAVTVLMLVGAAAWRVEAISGKADLAAAVSIGAWSAALPGALALLALRWFWSVGATESALVAAAVAIGPWALRPVDRQAADEAEVGGARLVQTAGRLATLVALAVAMAVMFKARGWPGLAWFAPLLVIVVGWVIPAPTAWRRIVRGLLGLVCIPAVTACVAVRVDLVNDFAFWPILVLLLLSGDGRWLGAFMGALILGGRRGLRTMRLVLGAMAAGPTQLAVTAVAVWSWSLSGTYALGLLLGAVLVEVMAPARRSLAHRITETEDQLTADS